MHSTRFYIIIDNCNYHVSWAAHKSRLSMTALECLKCCYCLMRHINKGSVYRTNILIETMSTFNQIIFQLTKKYSIITRYVWSQNNGILTVLVARAWRKLSRYNLQELETYENLHFSYFFFFKNNYFYYIYLFYIILTKNKI